MFLLKLYSRTSRIYIAIKWGGIVGKDRKIIREIMGKKIFVGTRKFNEGKPKFVPGKKPYDINSKEYIDITIISELMYFKGD